MNKLSNEFEIAIVEILEREQCEVIFTGSVSLYLQNKLQRHPNDIDCFTKNSYYGDQACVEVNRESSLKFWDSTGKLIEVVKGRSANGVPIDYMYRSDMPSYIYKRVTLNEVEHT